MTHSKKWCILLTLAVAISLAQCFVVFEREALEERVPVNYQFKWDSSTPSANAYTIEGKKITRKTDGGFPQITSVYPLIDKQTVINLKFSTYAAKVRHVITFGLCTESWKNKSQTTAGWKQGSVGYWSTNAGKYEQDYGSVWLDGKQIIAPAKDLFVPENGMLKLQVDLSKKFVVFYNQGKEMARFENIQWLDINKVYVVAIIQLQGKSVEVV